MKATGTIDPKPLIETVQKRLIESGFEPSDREIAEIMGKSKQTILRWRMGKRKLRYFEADHYAVAILGMSPYEIWGNDFR